MAVPDPGQLLAVRKIRKWAGPTSGQRQNGRHDCTTKQGCTVRDDYRLRGSVRSKKERTGRLIEQIRSPSHRDTEITEKKIESHEVPRCREWLPAGLPFGVPTSR